MALLGDMANGKKEIREKLRNCRNESKIRQVIHPSKPTSFERNFGEETTGKNALQPITYSQNKQGFKKIKPIPTQNCCKKIKCKSNHFTNKTSPPPSSHETKEICNTTLKTELNIVQQAHTNLIQKMRTKMV